MRACLRQRAVKAITLSAGFAVAAFAVNTPAIAADYYAGKTITFIVGGNSGGGYDVYARTIARHLNDHIPGHPEIVVQDMPGAGSAKAAAFAYKKGPKDGTMLLAVYPGAIMNPLLGVGPQGQYKPTEFQYIGTADNGTRMCITWHSSKTKTYEDAMKRKTVLGASANGGSTVDYGRMSNNLTGTKFDIAAGYKGSVDILLAMERGEVDGMCGYDWSSLRAQRPDWVRDKKVNYLLQTGLEPQPDLTKLGVPQMWKYIHNEEDRKAAALIVTQQVFGRPYFMPQGTDPQAVKIVRKAYDETMKDPAFLADAKKARIDIEPLSGEKVQSTVEKLYASPKNVVENAKRATTEEKSKN